MTFKALGKHYRDGISLMRVFEMFPNDEAAEKWFVKARWNDKITCPRCQSDNIQVKTTHATMPHRCRKCRKFFSVKTGTVMQNSNLGYKVWAIAIYLQTTSLKSISSMKLHRDLDITQKAAWHLVHRIKETYFDGKKEPFTGINEADDGGLEKNKHQNKKLNSGRGGVGKSLLVGMKNRNTNQITAGVVENIKSVTLHDFVESNTEPKATGYTDEERGYIGIARKHNTVCHSQGEYVKGNVYTNGIESFWAMFKRAQKELFTE